MEPDRTKLFDYTISLCDEYIKNKDFENAFREINRATTIINNPTDQFDYLWKLFIIKDKSARICISEKNPHYDYFLIFSLEAFALDIARDLVGFPILAPFYYRKKSKFSPYCDEGYDGTEISPDKDDDMDISLKKLNIYNLRKAVFREYINFIYNELPIIYGIPIKYNEDSLRRILDSMSTNRDQYLELMDFSEAVKQKNISIIPFKIHEFVSKLLQEYYDRENP